MKRYLILFLTIFLLSAFTVSAQTAAEMDAQVPTVSIMVFVNIAAYAAYRKEK